MHSLRFAGILCVSQASSASRRHPLRLAGILCVSQAFQASSTGCGQTSLVIRLAIVKFDNDALLTKSTIGSCPAFPAIEFDFKIELSEFGNQNSLRIRGGTTDQRG